MTENMMNAVAPFRAFDYDHQQFYTIQSMEWGPGVSIKSVLGYGPGGHVSGGPLWSNTPMSNIPMYKWEALRVDRSVGIMVKGRLVYENDLLLFTYKDIQWVAYVGYDQGAYTINHPWFGHITAKGIVKGEETAYVTLPGGKVEPYKFTDIRVLTMAIPKGMSIGTFAGELEGVME